MVRQNDIVQYARTQPTFTRKQMLDDFGRSGIDFSPNTVMVALRRLVQDGTLSKPSRGYFQLTEAGRKTFSPFFDDEMVRLSDMLTEEFPFLRFCVWSSHDIDRFSHNILNLNVIWVDVERDGVESVFNALSNYDTDRHVVIKPTETDYERYIIGTPTIAVRQLISESPLACDTKGRQQVTVEKILVDVVKDPDFFALQGFDMLRFYRNVHNHCTVNRQKLLRYARRRNCAEEITKLLNDMNNIEDYDTYR